MAEKIDGRGRPPRYVRDAVCVDAWFLVAAPKFSLKKVVTNPLISEVGQVGFRTNYFFPLYQILIVDEEPSQEYRRI